MKKVFLGGPTDISRWREQLIPLLKIDYREGARQKVECDFCLYVISPLEVVMQTIAEAVQDSCRIPAKTVFCVLAEDGGSKFDEPHSEALLMIARMIERNGGMVFGSLEMVAAYLNESYAEIAYDPNLIECLIKRVGPTEINLHKDSYSFDENELGDKVCMVLSAGHRKHLLSLPGFQIYQSHLAPKQEFTDDVISFKQQWERLSADTFLAFVNGHIGQFNNSQKVIREIAITKWKAILSHMQCPILEGADKDRIVFGDNEGIQKPEPDQVPFAAEELTPEDIEACKPWKMLNGNMFEKYVLANEDLFIEMPENMYLMAQEKWNKLIKDRGGNPWPLEDEAVETKNNDSSRNNSKG